MNHDVTVFKPYPFVVGQKIRIEESRRAGDWEIAAVGKNTVTLRCPISHKEFEWNIFCYNVEERKDSVWPQPD
jgi:hypothetical protein